MRRLFSRFSRTPESAPSIPVGRRIYAIGDVHGCLLQLDVLLERIRADHLERGAAQPTIILLGDLVDRGPDSAGVVQRVMNLCASDSSFRCLLGNHEELLLGALLNDAAALRAFCRFGGRETMMSYGVSAQAYDEMSYDEVAATLSNIVPARHVEFLSACEDLIEIGDYAFVHAGVRPGIALTCQKTHDLRWIREPFLSHARPFERMIVHGHTISAEVDRAGNRIGVDTGAYLTGNLSALGLEGNDQWIIDTRDLATN